VQTGERRLERVTLLATGGDSRRHRERIQVVASDSKRCRRWYQGTPVSRRWWAWSLGGGGRLNRRGDLDEAERRE
jgi:hypothetical protein